MSYASFRARMYADRTGQFISSCEWSRLMRAEAYWRVDETTVGRYWVSTVWLGTNANAHFNAPPLIFETMIKTSHRDDDSGTFMDYQVRYETEAQAKIGHVAAIEYAKALMEERVVEDFKSVIAAALAQAQLPP